MKNTNKFCKHNVYQVMANAGIWGPVKMFRNGFLLEIPESCLTKAGTIKTPVKNLINDLTLKNATILNRKYGVVIHYKATSLILAA